ncbi:hypothetical protein [Rothia nasimurium]|uniref:hypothetical protein n=1 Tax=Rothia nasimurium TaxID=85336 RepID=UPI003B9FB7B4
MAEKKTAAASGAGLQPGAEALTAAHELQAVTPASVQKAYEALVADLEAGNFEIPQDVRPAGIAETLKDFAPGLGSDLRHPDLIARFEGVKENLEREIKGGMCTPEQAYAYLENLEISLLLEQEAAVSA